MTPATRTATTCRQAARSGSQGTKIGVSWGQSNLDRGSNDLVNIEPREEERVRRGRYLSSADRRAVSRSGEYTQTQATSHSGNQAQEDSFAFGAILFY